jgi:hypothetical protein
MRTPAVVVRFRDALANNTLPGLGLQFGAHATRIHGLEYADHREWVGGDLNGDGRVDYVVLYTIENGNNYSTYLVALLQETRGYRAIAPVKVGGRGKRFVHLDSVARGRIKLQVERFAASDPLCCPSLKSATEFSLKNGSLSERAAPTERKHRPEPPSQVDAKP